MNNLNNLIDLSFKSDGEPLLTVTNNSPVIPETVSEAEKENCSIMENRMNENMGTKFALPLISNCNSLINNNTLNDDDPFDKVEKEAISKAKQMKIPAQRTVKVDQLISLNDDVDELTIELDDYNKYEDCTTPYKHNVQKPELQTAESINCSLYLNCSKLKKSSEYQKNLLKVSLTNSTWGSFSPSSKTLLLDNGPNTPVPSMFIKHLDFNQPLLADESPLKLISDDDDDDNDNNDADLNVFPDCSSIIGSSVTDDEKKFEADLEMLKIPILDEMAEQKSKSKLKLCSPTIHTNYKDDQDETMTNNDKKIISKETSNLETIKAKLEYTRNGIRQVDTNDLINHIKTIMITEENLLNEEKKQQVAELLENLKSKVGQSDLKNSVNDLLQNHNDTPLKSIEELPQCMVSSTSTYDGENEPNDGLNRPEIISVASEENLTEMESSSLPTSPSPLTTQTDLNDIFEQLTKVISDSDGLKASSTVILVMKTPSTKDISEHKIAEHSPTFSNESIIPRRRSQSLSLHDKVKIYELPPVSKKLTTIMSHESVKENSHSIQNSTSRIIPKCEASGRALRRNSFSGDKLHLRNNKATTNDTNYKDVKNQAHEQPLQKNFVINPMRMPILRPDPKKRIKLNTDSIMKSSAPLKATIPVKKIVSTNKISPVTPTQSSQNTSSTEFINKSSYNINRSTTINAQMTVTSTPILQGRRSSVNGMNNPKIFSKPYHVAASNSSVIINTTSAVKSKYSQAATRSSLMPSTSSSSVAATKRRTISELKIKSPGKIGKSVPKTTCGTTKSTTISLSGNRYRSTSINPSRHLSNQTKICKSANSRLSMNPTNLTSNNKENKRP